MTKLNINQVLHLVDSGGFSRKPASWKEVGKPIPLNMLIGLTVHRATELGIANMVGANFKFPTDTVFLVESDGGLYLVNTEGGDYARYIRYIGPAELLGLIPPAASAA